MAITKEMGIGEIVEKHPETQKVFQCYGFGCSGFIAAYLDQIDQGALAHSIDIEALVSALNKAIR